MHVHLHYFKLPFLFKSMGNRVYNSVRFAFVGALSSVSLCLQLKAARQKAKGKTTKLNTN